MKHVASRFEKKAFERAVKRLYAPPQKRTEGWSFSTAGFFSVSEIAGMSAEAVDETAREMELLAQCYVQIAASIRALQKTNNQQAPLSEPEQTAEKTAPQVFQTREREHFEALCALFDLSLADAVEIENRLFPPEPSSAD